MSAVIAWIGCSPKSTKADWPARAVWRTACRLASLPGFDRLLAHAARTRRLSAGTIIGSGTVSNADYRNAGSACIAEKRAIEKIDKGEATLAFMRFGDRVRIEVLDADGRSVCGAIDQRIVEG